MTAPKSVYGVTSERPHIEMVKPPRFKWRAIHVHPTLVDVGGLNRVRFWWGQDIWFGRWPILKIQAVILAVLVWRSFR